MMELTVYCDGPGHVRGKTTEWVFVHLGQGWMDNDQLREKGPPRSPGWLARSAPWGGLRHDYGCNLCGLRLTCSPKTLELMLNGFAAHGESRITLRALVLLASSGRV